MALTPASACSSAASNDSYRSSSIRVPVNTVAMDAPVLRRPCVRRCSQPARGPLAGLAVAATGTVPAPGVAAEPGVGAGAGAKACVGPEAATAGGAFLRKKLNMGNGVTVSRYNAEFWRISSAG